jgi:hypothetical protein
MTNREAVQIRKDRAGTQASDYVWLHYYVRGFWKYHESGTAMCQYLRTVYYLNPKDIETLYA